MQEADDDYVSDDDPVLAVAASPMRHAAIAIPPGPLLGEQKRCVCGPTAEARFPELTAFL